MTKKLTSEVLKTATFVSGLVGLANSDLTKASTELSKENWDKAILIEETNKGSKISIGIIVDSDVRTKIVAFEIHSSIKALLKKNNIKLDKLNVYVRGVK